MQFTVHVARSIFMSVLPLTAEQLVQRGLCHVNEFDKAYFVSFAL